MTEHEIDMWYARLTRAALNFILETRKIHHDIPIVDILVSFCFKYDIELEELGDAISQDVYFKELIQLDNAVKTVEESKLELEDW